MAATFQLVMRSGPTPGATFALEGDQLIIGRDVTSNIAIGDAEVSRKHARLTFQGGKYVIEDLGSTNGTFVNGQRLTGPVVLKPGDLVALGEQIVLVYESLASDAGATMMSRGGPARPPATAVGAPAVSVPPPPPASVPTPSTPVSPEPVTPAGGRNNLVIFGAIGIVVLICICAAALWYVDSNYLWCTFFPFLSGC
ncbi:MAG: FHA domain-containing protein [Anaerolineales bacterium]